MEPVPSPRKTGWGSTTPFPNQMFKKQPSFIPESNAENSKKSLSSTDGVFEEKPSHLDQKEIIVGAVSSKGHSFKISKLKAPSFGFSAFGSHKKQGSENFLLDANLGGIQVNDPAESKTPTTPTKLSRGPTEANNLGVEYDLRRQLADMEENRNHYHQETNRLLLRIKDFESALKIDRQTTKQTEEQKQALSVQISELNAKLMVSEEAIKGYIHQTNEITTYRSEIHSLKSKLTAAEFKISQMTMEAKLLSSENEHLKNTSAGSERGAADVNLLQEQLKAMNESLDRTKALLDAVTGENGVLSAENDALRKKQALHDRAILDAKSKSESLAAENSVLRSQIGELMAGKDAEIEKGFYYPQGDRWSES